MPKLSRLLINNFKSIKDADIELKDINILIGANGAGKSNFISFFKMLNCLIENRFQEYVNSKQGADNILYNGLKKSQELKFNVYFGANHYAAILKPAQESLFFSKEQISFENNMGKPNVHYIDLSGSETGLFSFEKKNITRIVNYVISSLKSWKVFHFHDTSDSAKIKQQNELHDNREFREDGSNIAAFLYLLQQKHSEQFTLIENTIKLVMPYFKRFRLEPLALNPNNIRLEWEENGSEKLFTTFHLSDGSLRMICLITLLLQPSPPTTIIIDEPELGLHPAAIELLATLIQKAAENSQIIVATQSTALLNYFEPEDIIVADKTVNGTTLQRLKKDDLNDWLTDYSLGKIWEKNLIGGNP